MPAKTGEETLYVRTSDARYPCGSCSFPRIIRIRFPPRDEPQTINQAQNRKIHSSTPPPRGRLPKDRRENEPSFMRKVPASHVSCQEKDTLYRTCPTSTTH